jgi:CBS domain-containing protein/uncharacterized protein (DUF2267 family)
MSLRAYRRPRLIALNPQTPVREAARALENNDIGAVIVQHNGQVTGIVTDRDLAVRALAYGRESAATTLTDIMTKDVSTLSSYDHQADAILLMQNHGIRRIPLVDEGRLVGMVTLDDLILDEAVSLEQIAAVVEAQIGAGGPAIPPKSSTLARSAARAQTTYGRWLNELRTDAHLQSTDEARTALETVSSALVRRLTADEAKDLISQLPSLLRAFLLPLPAGPDRRITRQSIENDLAQRLNLNAGQAADILEIAAFTIASHVSGGQMNDVRGQLPQDLRPLFRKFPRKAYSHRLSLDHEPEGVPNIPTETHFH